MLTDLPRWAGFFPAVIGALGVALALPELLQAVGCSPPPDGDLVLSAAGCGAIGFSVLVAIPQLILGVARRGISLPRPRSGPAIREGRADGSQRWDEPLAALNLSAVVIAVLGALPALISRRHLLRPAGGRGRWAAGRTGCLPLDGQRPHGGGVSEAEMRGLAFAAAGAAILWLLADLARMVSPSVLPSRLSSAFFVRRTGRARTGELGVEALDYAKPLLLSTLDSGSQFPKLIVCRSANVSDAGKTLPGRAATPLTFPRARLAGRLSAECWTSTFEARADRALGKEHVAGRRGDIRRGGLSGDGEEDDPRPDVSDGAHKCAARRSGARNPRHGGDLAKSASHR